MYLTLYTTVFRHTTTVERHHHCSNTRTFVFPDIIISCNAKRVYIDHYWTLNVMREISVQKAGTVHQLPLLHYTPSSFIIITHNTSTPWRLYLTPSLTHHYSYSISYRTTFPSPSVLRHHHTLKITTHTTYYTSLPILHFIRIRTTLPSPSVLRHHYTSKTTLHIANYTWTWITLLHPSHCKTTNSALWALGIPPWKITPHTTIYTSLPILHFIRTRITLPFPSVLRHYPTLKATLLTAHGPE